MIYVSFVFAILIALLAIFFVGLKFSKAKTFALSALFIAVAFCFGVIMFGFFYASTTSKNPLEIVFSSVYSGIKMFALGNNADAFVASETVKYSAENLELLSIVFVRYIGQIGALVIASSAIISTINKTLKLSWRKVFVFFIHLFGIRGVNRKGYSLNVLYTDLNFEQIKPFLQKLQENPKSINKVVILKTDAATQHGQELTELVKMMDIEVLHEGFDPYAMRKLCVFKKKYKVNFYSMFENDANNLAFADTALKFYKKFNEAKGKKNNKLIKIYDDRVKEKEAKLKTETDPIEIQNLKEDINKYKVHPHSVGDKFDVDFYVSFQDESFNNKTNYSRLSNGRIKLVSEYDSVASKFVFENPITRFVDVRNNNFLSSLKTESEVHFHFIGFGRINQALASKMVPNYQLPLDNVQVKYHIASKGAVELHLKKTFLARFGAVSEIYKNNPAFLPQRELDSVFFEKDLDVDDDESLFEYAKHVVKIIEDAQKHNAQAKNTLIVALGNDQYNVDVALKLRTHIRNIAASSNDTLLKGIYEKSVIIHPYVKDNYFFKQSLSVFDGVTKLILDSGIAVENITRDTYLDFAKKYARKHNKNFYNNDLSFVFETCYPKEICSKNPFGLKNHVYFKLYDIYRDASYMYEECPLVVFGRGGYIGDEIYEAIVYLAKHINKHYFSIKNPYEMDIAWNNLNYQDQQSNIGCVLSFPMKANILGYKLVWDKEEKLENYIYCKKYENSICKKKARKYANIEALLNACYPGFIECYKKYLASKDDLNYINKIIHYDGIFDKALDVNKDRIYSLMSKKMQSKLSKDNLTVENIRKAFNSIYEEAFNAYRDAGEGKAKGHVLKDAQEMFKDYFNIVFKGLVTEEFLVIRNVEHNRWYMDKTEHGVVPRTIVNKISSSIKENKSFDGLRHHCMTTNNGLDMLGDLMIEKIVEEGKIIDGKIPASINDLGFGAEDKLEKEKLLFDVFNMNYLSDVFQYNVLANYVMENFESLCEKDKFVKKHTFVLRERKNDIESKQ